MLNNIYKKYHVTYDRLVCNIRASFITITTLQSMLSNRCDTKLRLKLRETKKFLISLKYFIRFKCDNPTYQHLQKLKSIEKLMDIKLEEVRLYFHCN